MTLRPAFSTTSKVARDNVLKSGMDAGIAASYDRLDAVLESTE